MSAFEVAGGRTALRPLFVDAWRHRALLVVLARQHFQGQYRAARLGIAWTAIQPLVRGAVLAVVFTQIVPIETDIPYPAFILAGTSTWAFIQGSVTSGTTSIVATGGLATKVYFPRLLVPAMPAMSLVPSFMITLVIVIMIGLPYGQRPGWHLLVLPVGAALSVALVAAISSVASLLHVYFRDVGHLMASGMLIVFYATPVIYPVDVDASRLIATLFALNPFTGAVGLVRWSLFGAHEPLLIPVASTVAWTLVLGIIGIRSFQTHDRICVDRL